MDINYPLSNRAIKQEALIKKIKSSARTNGSDSYSEGLRSLSKNNGK